MIPLPSSFKKSGWDYRLIDRTGDVAIFEQSRADVTIKRFEVVVVQRHSGYLISGKEIPAAEHMPSGERWGELGFTCETKDRAFQKAEQLSFR